MFKNNRPARLPIVSSISGRLRPFSLIIATVLCATICTGLATQPALAHLSVATTDNFLAANVNPAALSFGNAAGFGYVGGYDSGGAMTEDYSLFFNTDFFAYAWNKAGDAGSHTLAFSSKLSPCLYSGSSYIWPSGDFGDGGYSLSLLFRPVDLLSFGAVSRSLFTPDATYSLGLALRPLFMNKELGHTVTLFSDVDYNGMEWTKPLVGIETELIRGVNLGGSYSLENESYKLHLGLSIGNLTSGNLTAIDSENEISGGSYYAGISAAEYLSFLKKDKKTFHDFKLTEEIIETSPVHKIGPFNLVDTESVTLRQVLRKIESLKNDDSVAGILFKSGNISTSFANLTELRDALLDFKSTGKKIVFYYEFAGNTNYVFAASVADEIYLNPLGGVDLRGLGSSIPYMKDLFGKLGIELVNVRSHDYKTGLNPLTESEMTEAERETYEYLFEGLYTEFAGMLDSGRSEKLKKPARETIDEGPYWLAEDALKAGLVDRLAFEYELEDLVKERFSATELTEERPGCRIRYSWGGERRDRIALIYAIGMIHPGKGDPGRSIGSTSLAEAIEKAREDESVKGILIRVDSGGGSALASEIIAREVMRCKEGDDAKPVVVSMGGVAGSGGYYIACRADKIIAEPTTITGSIGALSLLANLEELYDKIGVNWETVKKGENADLFSSHRQPTEEELERLRRYIEDVYWKFVDMVAEGRNLTRDEVHEVAKGRVWTGTQALDRKLIDRLGGIETALEELKTLAGIDRDVALVEYPGPGEGITIKLDMGQTTNLLGVAMPKEFEPFLELSDMLRHYDENEVLMIMPHPIEIE